MNAALSVELLTREGCGLCAKALSALEAVAREGGLSVTAVDIDHDPALLREFDWRVPVVRVAGRVVCEGLITEADLRAALGRPAVAP
jgi:glutaredoxin